MMGINSEWALKELCEAAGTLAVPAATPARGQQRVIGAASSAGIHAGRLCVGITHVKGTGHGGFATQGDCA